MSKCDDSNPTGGPKGEKSGWSSQTDCSSDSFGLQAANCVEPTTSHWYGSENIHSLHNQLKVYQIAFSLFS